MLGYHQFKLVVSSVVLALSLTVAADALARRPAPTGAGENLPSVALAELPPQGREVHGLILRGGPFPHGKDGTVFGNRERMLPAHQRGYYREYTVPTPGSRDRGARRIVCGGEARTPDACYYTGDHYASFRKIVQ